MSYKIDTGAQCNIIPVESISPKPDLQPVNVKLSAYNGSKIPAVGKCSLALDHENNSPKVSFIVVDSDSVPILGLKTSKHSQLIKRICQVEANSETVFSEFHDCFREIGTLNTTHHIEVREMGTLNTTHHTEGKYNVKPVVTPVQKVPQVLKPKLEKELQQMVNLDNIELFEKPTDWVNGLVIGEKPNEKLHICLDPQPFNNAIKHEHLHLSTAEEIFSQMSNACFFSKLDVSLGYCQSK